MYTIVYTVQKQLENAFGTDLTSWKNHSAVSKIVKAEGCPLEVLVTTESV